MAKKFLTESEAESRRLKAVEFMGRVGGDVAKFESMSPAEYAEGRGFELLQNPLRRVATMTKQELAATLDEVADGLDECLDPSLTREEVIQKVQELSDLAAGEETEDDESGNGDTDED